MLFGSADRLAQATHNIRIRISLRMGPPPNGYFGIIADGDGGIVTEMSFKRFWYRGKHCKAARRATCGCSHRMVVGAHLPSSLSAFHQPSDSCKNPNNHAKIRRIDG